jgi:hypothetical protein
MYEDIKRIEIVPLSDDEKRALIEGADSTTKIYEFPFHLSEPVVPKWVEIFSSVWSKEYGGGPIPRFAASTVYMRSTLQNLQNLVNAFKLVSGRANDQFRAFIEQKVREEEEEQKRKDEAKKAAEQAMSDTLDKLKF